MHIELATSVLDVVMRALEGRDCWIGTDRVVNIATKVIGTTLTKYELTYFVKNNVK